MRVSEILCKTVMAEQPFQHILLPAVGGGPDFSSSNFFAARDFSWRLSPMTMQQSGR